MTTKPYTMFGLSSQTTRARQIKPVQRLISDGSNSSDEASYIASNRTSIPTSVDDSEQQLLDMLVALSSFFALSLSLIHSLSLYILSHSLYAIDRTSFISLRDFAVAVHM